jgi:hypothetical protein
VHVLCELLRRCGQDQYKIIAGKNAGPASVYCNVLILSVKAVCDSYRPSPVHHLKIISFRSPVLSLQTKFIERGCIDPNQGNVIEGAELACNLNRDSREVMATFQ